MTETLKPESDIFEIAKFIEDHINANWQLVFEANQKKLLNAYRKAGDAAYGTYLELLFKEVHKALRAAKLKIQPRLPGEFDISREWGNADETDQQRWMWSTIKPIGQGEPLGTIVTITYHDHSQFRLPRAPGVFAIEAVGKEAVVESLAQRSEDFKAAREASIEIAEYLASLEAQQ